MSIEFSKMHGLGNDFVVIQAITQTPALSEAIIRKIADRKLGIGCDQVLVLSKSTTTDADFDYQIFNADGSKVMQCGNGARCIAKFAYDKGFIREKTIRLNTNNRVMTASLDKSEVTVELGKPDFEPSLVPFSVDVKEKQYELTGPTGQILKGCVLSMGNPHLVVFVNDVEKADLVSHGQFFNQHSLFPEGVNVGFVEVISPGVIKMRVYERGVGETLACGSGACAGVVAGHMLGLLEEAVLVELRGGSLTIKQSDYEQVVLMRGPAVWVFDGIFSD